MMLVVDTNRIMAALIRDSFSRAILLSNKFYFVIPEKALDEIKKYEEEICAKAGVNKEYFEILLSLILKRVEVVPAYILEPIAREIKGLIDDPGDIPFLSCALAKQADGIWTEDAHFKKQNRVKIFSTRELAEFIK